jgi:hypothetical protein
MPNSLEGVLASIPGLGGYLAKGQYDQQRTGQGLQQAGALLALQKHLHEQNQEQAFRTGLEGLGPNPTQEGLAGLAARFAAPRDVLAREQGSLDRQAGIQAARDARAASLEQAKASADQMHEFRMSRLKDQAARDAETARHNLAIEGLRVQLEGLKGDRNKPPAGYRPTSEGNLEAIPGGPADTKLQGVLNQDTASLQSTTSSMDRLAAAANEALNHPGLAGTTGLRGSLPNIPGTAAADAAAKLGTLKSQVAFGVLQEMRNNSKTGGALGAVSDKEGALLQANLAALDKSQSVEQMKESLQKIIDYTSGAKDRLRSAYNLKHGDKKPGAAPASQSVDQLLEKYK